MRARRVLAAIVLALGALAPAGASAQQGSALHAEIDRTAERLVPKLVAWRRDIHQHPELGNREFRTARLVADHLRALGMEVDTGVAHTGVVGVLRGARPGRVVALRADMDALPVTEQVDVPFASKVRAVYNGQEVGVMHACGHDNHVAILMGVAELLAGMRERLSGTVKFVFQPAEEGPPPGEPGGAGLMIEEGVLENPKVDAVFGLHAWAAPVGTILYRPGGLMASSDRFTIVVRGRQTHGALPWDGIDPIVVSSQIVNALQTIVSRQVKLVRTPAIITVGSINGGIRFNIVPDSVVMTGTIRVFDDSIRTDILERVRRTAEHVAQSAGASAEVSFGADNNPVTYNDPVLTERMLPTLRRVTTVQLTEPTTTAEDFSKFQQRVPGLYFFLGITPPGTTPIPNHSPFFVADEAALPIGVRALASLAVDYLAQ